MLILWLCWWWMRQCLCHESHLHPKLPSPGPRDSGQGLPSLNYSLTERKPARNSIHLAPGINENIHYNKENTPSSIIPVTQSEKVHNEVFKKNSTEQVKPLGKPSTYTNNSVEQVNPLSESPTYTNNSTERINPLPQPPTYTNNSAEQVNPLPQPPVYTNNSTEPPAYTDKDDHENHASKNTSSTTETNAEKSGHHNLQVDRYSKDETHTHSNYPVYVNDGLPATESFANGENTCYM